MSEWEQPHQRLLNCSEPSATGRHLGFINRKYFEPTTWEPLLGTEMGRAQYSKFVASMIDRIRVKESSYDEIRNFVHLVATEHNWDFMKVAMPYLPELKEQYPHDTKNFEIALLFLLKPKIRRRSIKEIGNAFPAPKTFQSALSKTEEQLLRRNLFGPNRGAVDSPGMNRLFKSTLELGYPQPALDQAMREAKARGTDIERCSEGLPRNMLMPNAHTRPDKLSSSTYNHEAATPGVWVPSTSTITSRVSSSSTIKGNEPTDSPPWELLTELAVDGLDPPVPTTPEKPRISHGELLKLNRIENVQVSPFCPAESPDLPQLPCEEPTRIHYGPSEREADNVYLKQPVSVFLNCFHVLERVPDQLMPRPNTEWLGPPNSPSTSGHSLIDAVWKPIQTDTVRVVRIAIPECEQAPDMIASVTGIVETDGEKPETLLRLSEAWKEVREQGCCISELSDGEIDFIGCIPSHSFSD